MTVKLECRTHVPAGVQETFDRSRSIDLHTASMSDSRERAIAGVTAGLINEGEEVTWRAWHFGVPIRMTSRITEMAEPEYFVDEQVRGPFRSFRHEHEFRPDGSGTLMIAREVRRATRTARQDGGTGDRPLPAPPHREAQRSYRGN